MDVQGLLKSIGVAATNPLAFVAYLGAIICWGLLRWRVDRNKNLLDQLHKIPERQRAALIRDEMGIDEVRGGTTAEQRLRSRIHSYYFLAFVVLCAVAVVIVAIAKFTQAQTVDPNKVLKVEMQNDQDAAEDRSTMRKLTQIKLNVNQDFVRSKLSEPNSKGTLGKKTCWGYDLPKARIKMLFGSDKTLKMFFVVITDSSYRFPLMGRWDTTRRQARSGIFLLTPYETMRSRVVQTWEAHLRVPHIKPCQPSYW